METSLNNGRNLRLSPEEYAKKLWDWTPLNQCFERGIRLTDIDGMVEVNHHFLFLEGKTIGINMPRGQKMALERLAVLPEFTVIIFEGNPPNLNTITAWKVLGKKEYKNKTIKDFLNFIYRWFVWAEENNTQSERS